MEARYDYWGHDYVCGSDENMGFQNQGARDDQAMPAGLFRMFRRKLFCIEAIRQ